MLHFIMPRAGEEYFPLYIDPQSQAALTGNHFPTVAPHGREPTIAWADDPADGSS
jgi:hypothetical protein